MQPREKAGNQSTKQEKKYKIRQVKAEQKNLWEVKILKQENLPRIRLRACQEGYQAVVLNLTPGNSLNIWVMLQVTTRKTNNNTSEVWLLQIKKSVEIFSLL